MAGHRSRATRPALALWLLVLVAASAAAGTATALVYVLAGAVVLALVLAVVLVEAGPLAARREQLRPLPVRVRATRHPYGRSRPGRR